MNTLDALDLLGNGCASGVASETMLESFVYSHVAATNDKTKVSHSLSVLHHAAKLKVCKLRPIQPPGPRSVGCAELVRLLATLHQLVPLLRHREHHNLSRANSSLGRDRIMWPGPNIFYP